MVHTHTHTSWFSPGQKKWCNILQWNVECESHGLLPINVRYHYFVYHYPFIFEGSPILTIFMQNVTFCSVDCFVRWLNFLTDLKNLKVIVRKEKIYFTMFVRYYSFIEFRCDYIWLEESLSRTFTKKTNKWLQISVELR